VLKPASSSWLGINLNAEKWIKPLLKIRTW
jgi:hypothetical protein